MLFYFAKIKFYSWQNYIIDEKKISTRENEFFSIREKNDLTWGKKYFIHESYYIVQLKIIFICDKINFLFDGKINFLQQRELSH